MRRISKFERVLIEGVARKLHPSAASKLINDMDNASVDDSVGGRSRVLFIIDGYGPVAYKGQHQYPVEMRLIDADGADLTAILYADENDRLCELEIIRWDGAEPMSPDLESISYF